MKQLKLISIKFFVLLFSCICLNSVFVLADTTSSSSPKLNYDKYEVETLKNFFGQKTISGETNGERIQPFYNADDVTTWDSVTWGKDGKVIKLDFDYLETQDKNDFLHLGIDVLERDSYESWKEYLPYGDLELKNFTSLEYLNCSYGQINNLDLTGCYSLKTMKCHFNNLKKIDLKDCKNLEYINISYNYLNNLDFKNFDSIKTIRCGSNNIRRIDLTGCFSLTTLECDNNNLQKLDISDCQNIDKLIFGGNQITDENFKMNENATLSLLSNGENLLQHIAVKASDGNLYSVTCSGNGSVGMFLNTGKYEDYVKGVCAHSYGFDKDSIYKGWNIDNCNPDKYNDELDMIENNLTEVSTAFLQRDISDSSIIENLANKVDTNSSESEKLNLINKIYRLKYEELKKLPLETAEKIEGLFHKNGTYFINDTNHIVDVSVKGAIINVLWNFQTSDFVSMKEADNFIDSDKINETGIGGAILINLSTDSMSLNEDFYSHTYENYDNNYKDKIKGKLFVQAARYGSRDFIYYPIYIELPYSSSEDIKLAILKEKYKDEDERISIYHELKEEPKEFKFLNNQLSFVVNPDDIKIIAPQYNSSKFFQETTFSYYILKKD